jgi:hypothetical protein
VDHPGLPERPAAAVDQRLVEMAAIGLALRLVPDKIWAPLTPVQRDRAAAYLTQARAFAHVDNNWKFFRLMLDMGLKTVGIPVDQASHDFLCPGA